MMIERLSGLPIINIDLTDGLRPPRSWISGHWVCYRRLLDIIEVVFQVQYIILPTTGHWQWFIIEVIHWDWWLGSGNITVGAYGGGFRYDFIILPEGNLSASSPSA